MIAKYTVCNQDMICAPEPRKQSTLPSTTALLSESMKHNHLSHAISDVQEASSDFSALTAPRACVSLVV
jgi:hypothetical protein